MATISAYAQQLSILNSLNASYSKAAKSATQVTTGSKINSAADDASAYAIAKRMGAEISSLEQASSNVQTGQSMLNVADGAMSNTMDILTTLKEKAVAAANSTYKDSDRATMQKEFNQYLDQINDNSLVTYNGQYLMSGIYSGATKETTQAYTNTSLATDTTGATKLTDLADRNGNSLGIASTDTITVSYVKDGKTVTNSYSAADTSLADIFNKTNGAAGENIFDTSSMDTATSEIGTDSAGKTVTTTDGKNAITVKAGTAGTAGSISGFTINVTDSSGNEKKSVNNALDDFTETIAAADERNGNSLNIQTGTSSGYSTNINLGDISAKALGLQGSDGSYISIGTQADANAAINVIDNAIARLQSQQTTVGAYSSRMDYTYSNLTTQNENVTAAQSTITDADMAKAITEYTSQNVIAQAAQAMLAQSYSNSTWFLNLLG